ncbi:MAG: Ig-like domain-containing protein [Ruminococcus sp.]|jgi:hypothetical protein|nr:Ig-like domain-containing protein [Ruminococcus sp.]
MKAKRFLSIILALIMSLTVGITAFADEDLDDILMGDDDIGSFETGPELSRTSYTLTKGYQITLKVTQNVGSVIWSSTSSAVASVSQKGVVVGKKAGNADIYAEVDGKALRCRITVVDTKITLSKNNVSLYVDETYDVTVTVTGDKTGLSLTNSNRTVAVGSWKKPARWDGNKIVFTVTASKAGTSNIKIYRKGYENTYFKTMSVTVTHPNQSVPTSDQIAAYDTKVEVNAGESAPLRVWTSNVNSTTAVSADTSIAAVSLYDTYGSYITFKVDGKKAGQTYVRVYDKTDNEKYVNIPVVVSGADSYYNAVTTSPQKKASTDKVLSFKHGVLTYYILVPDGYDTALVASEIATVTGKFEYYTIYANSPTAQKADDDIQNVMVLQNGQYIVRYIMSPKTGVDKVRYQTAVAVYTKIYEYYTVYNERPTFKAATDTYASWNVTDTSGTNQTRYVLLPYGYDEARLSQIRSDDLNSTSYYGYYTVTTTMPIVDTTKETVFSWYDSTAQKLKYMVVPKTGLDFIKRNDAISKDTGKVYYFNAYSSAITVKDAKKEFVYNISIQSGNSFVSAYILVDRTDSQWYSKLSKSVAGTTYFAVPQGTFSSNYVYDENGRVIS